MYISGFIDISSINIGQYYLHFGRENCNQNWKTFATMRPYLKDDKTSSTPVAMQLHSTLDKIWELSTAHSENRDWDFKV